MDSQTMSLLARQMPALHSIRVKKQRVEGLPGYVSPKPISDTMI